MPTKRLVHPSQSSSATRTNLRQALRRRSCRIGFACGFAVGALGMVLGSRLPQRIADAESSNAKHFSVALTEASFSPRR